MNPSWIIPDWPAPTNVRACSTTRQGGVSLPPYDSLNLGDHVGDDPQAVHSNRQIVTERLHLPNSPAWLQQVHGTAVHHLSGTPTDIPQADASYSDQKGVVCAVMTADCLPLLLCDLQGSKVAAIHAGWRGLCDGVIEATVSQLMVPGEQLLVWLGPAIGPEAFEVGSEVREAFIARDPEAVVAFRQKDEQHWLADIYQLARQRLSALGITKIYGGDYCTYNDEQQFFSYRRDGITGRMASLIWME